MNFKPGDRVRAVHGQGRTEGTVRRVIPGKQIPMLSGEPVFEDDMIVVEWDEIPGATTAALRAGSLPASALEHVR